MKSLLRSLCVMLALAVPHFGRATESGRMDLSAGDPAALERDANDLIRSIRVRWFDADTPRHLNKILNQQISRVIELLMPEASDDVRIKTWLLLNRFAGDADEFDRRLGVDDRHPERLDRLAAITGRLLVSAHDSDLNDDAFGAQTDVTKALVPLIEAHLLIGVTAGTRPVRPGLATLRHWWRAGREAERSRARFWARLRETLREHAAWPELGREVIAQSDRAETDQIAGRVVKLISRITDPARACQRALSPNGQD